MKKLILLFLFPVLCFGQSSRFTIVHPPSGAGSETATQVDSAGLAAKIPYANILGKPTLGTMSRIDSTTYQGNTNTTKTGTITTGVWNGTPVDYSLNAYAALGSTIKAQTVGGNVNAITLGNNKAGGVCEFVAVWVPNTVTITGVKWYQVTQGNAIENNYNGVALYSYSAGTLTMIDSTTRDTAIWSGTSGTWQTKAFPATHILTPGIYYVGALWNRSSSTTSPSVGCIPTVQGTGVAPVDFTNSAKLNCYVTGQNTPPSSQLMSGTTNNNTIWYFALY